MKRLPIGIDDFRKLITEHNYYVDKTLLIKELKDKGGEVNLFTRPRRFGKTLTMSMLKCFYEIPTDGQEQGNLFQGLNIMKAGERYTSLHGQYPVISLTLKSAKQRTYEEAFYCLKEVIANEYARYEFIMKSMESEAERRRFYEIREGTASSEAYLTSIAFLSKCLSEYYHKSVVILIDEYDVPLENAYYTGFYDEMVGFIRSIFESSLKTNPYLEFAVITGCLRISKESIFTGLNNLNIISILSSNYSEYFGFTEQEVQTLLMDYHMEDHMNTVKDWYDGYRFGTAEVYNPWSVISYVFQLSGDEHALPIAAWSNSSSNRVVKAMIDRADNEAKQEIGELVSGKTLEKPVHEDITYEDIYASQDNLWNFLFFTGYLKQVDRRMEDVIPYVTLKIPNKEVLYIYKTSIAKWFDEQVKKQNLKELYLSIEQGDAEKFQEELGNQLLKTISYMDAGEDFYHGFVLGLLVDMDGYLRKSNREAGTGRFDILLYSNDVRKPAIILELKVADKFKLMEEACEKALTQIEEKRYDTGLEEEGYTQVFLFGIGFYKKQVRVKVKKKELSEG